jgi:hypothetical protein
MFRLRPEHRIGAGEGIVVWHGLFASFDESALADHFRDKYKPGCGGAKAVVTA